MHKNVAQKCSKIKKNLAFTLAEVLIVMGIIGIIAQMTIPDLVQKVQRQTYIIGAKKAYSILSQAYMTAIQDNGIPDTWNLVAYGDAGGNQNLLNIIAPYFKVVKNCGVSGSCFPDVNYKYLDNTNGPNLNTANTAWGTAELVDGSLILTSVDTANCSTNIGSGIEAGCGLLDIDVNGFKGPNQYGVDFFSFWFTKNRLVPMGTSHSTGVRDYVSFEGACRGSYGWGCTCMGNYEWEYGLFGLQRT